MIVKTLPFYKPTLVLPRGTINCQLELLVGKSGHSRVQEMNEDHPTRTNPGIAYNCGGSSFFPFVLPF